MTVETIFAPVALSGFHSILPDFSLTSPNMCNPRLIALLKVSGRKAKKAMIRPQSVPPAM
jgi:hypothetical protein